MGHKGMEPAASSGDGPGRGQQITPVRQRLPVTMINDTARQYRITLRGECGQLLSGIVDTVAIESRRGWTCMVVSVRDESELYGMLDRFQDLALHIVSLNELGADVLSRRGTAGGSR